MKHTAGCFAVACGIALWSVLISGCRHYQYDTPEIRRMQAASLKETTQRTIAGESLQSFFHSRVRLLVCFQMGETPNLEPREGESLDLGGRASAISSDGYFITAHHVVTGDIPYMVMRPAHPAKTQKLTDLHWIPGRVVKTFEPADVALLKFELPSAHWIRLTDETVKKGSEVFTGAADGVVFGEDKVGNGPFLVHGKVISMQAIEGMSAYRHIRSDMVSRGGMSGAPLIDQEGNFQGVLVGGRYRQWVKTFLSSEFHAIPASEIRNAIRMDRLAQHP